MEASESLSCEKNNISLFSALPESSNILQEESLGPDLLEFCFLPLSMYSFQIEYLTNSLIPVFCLVLVYPSHTELGL